MGHFLNLFRPVNSISADELKKWRAERDPNDHVVLDVRTPGEYERGHVPGARFIPLAELESRAGELDRELPVVTYCKVGGRSRSAAALLNTLGFRETYSVTGGIMAWNGLIAEGPPEAGMADFPADMSAVELASAAWKLECGSGRFYGELIKGVKETSFKELLHGLAVAEEQHKAGLETLIVELGGSPDDPRANAGYCETMEGGVAVSEGLAWASGRPADEVLEFLMGLETNALDLYLKVLGQTRDDRSRTVFSHLASEEREHLRRLENVVSGKG